MLELFITGSDQIAHPLSVQSVDWGFNLKYIDIYTNNPLNLTPSEMPVARLLLDQSISPPSWNVSLEIVESAVKEILPGLATN